jgi:hypothetical protein
VALIAVIATWAALLVAGWALIFWPKVPDGFRFDQGMTTSSDLLEAFHISW